VHQRAGYLVFGKEISQSQLSAVARGHVWADSAEHQTPEFSHMHAMRRPGQTKAEACAATNKFIKNEAQKALNAKNLAIWIQHYSISARHCTLYKMRRPHLTRVFNCGLDKRVLRKFLFI
jgi:hypothetical protein